MLNQRNYGIYEGRLAQDPVFFATAGGGENVILKPPQLHISRCCRTGKRLRRVQGLHP